MHLLLKKGPRQSPDNDKLPGRTGNEEEQAEHTSSDVPNDHYVKAVKMIYTAKRLAEQEVVTSLFHFLWTPEAYGCNATTTEVRPLLLILRRKCQTKPLSNRFASYRLKWQFEMVAEKVVAHARAMKQMCLRIPAYMKQLPILFFNLARMFVDAPCESFVKVQGCFRHHKEAKPLNRKETVELLSKTSRSFESFRRGMRHTHKKAGIFQKDNYLEGAFGAMLKSAEAFLAYVTIPASPYLIYDDKLYSEVLNYLRCSEGNASCWQSPEVCFLETKIGKGFVSDTEWDVNISGVFQLPLQGSNRNSLEALGFAAKFMQSSSRVYEKRLRELHVPETTIAALKLQVSESATVAYGFSMVQTL